jgi:hypothetical protein
MSTCVRFFGISSEALIGDTESPGCSFLSFAFSGTLASLVSALGIREVSSILQNDDETQNLRADKAFVRQGNLLEFGFRDGRKHVS